MKFSKAFGIKPKAADDWFDVLLSTDTRLFVDPFRIYVDNDKRWSSAHSDLIQFFNLVLKQIAKSDGKKTSAHWKAARRLMLFPEPSEFCLGYGDTPLGAGTGDGLQAAMLKSANATVKAGVKSVAHFEELMLFEDQIGADRISDVVCNVLKSYFIEYTQGVCKRHKIPTTSVGVAHTAWNAALEVWMDDHVELPVNPYTGRAVLLTPKRFLRKLPTVDPTEFWDWAWSNANEEIRGQFNYDLGKNVDAPTIARLARQNPRLARRYVKSWEKKPKPAYNVDKDPAGEVKWYDAGISLAKRAAVDSQPSTAAGFCKWVEDLLSAFAHNVEHQSGWRLLWTDTKPRSERHAQALFQTAVWQVCEALDVDFSGEPNAGRGPVDFKFSKGFKSRSLVEVKLTHNSQYWHGLKSQLPQYMTSEKIKCGYFMSVGFSDADFTPARKKLVTDAATEVAKATQSSVKVIFVDARPKKSASKKTKPK